MAPAPVVAAFFQVASRLFFVATLLVGLAVLCGAVAGLRVRESGSEPGHQPQHWSAEVVEGGTFIRRTPLLLHPTVALGLALLVIGFSESAVYAVVDAFGHPVAFVGPLLTVQGMGAVTSGLPRNLGGLFASSPAGGGAGWGPPRRWWSGWP